MPKRPPRPTDAARDELRPKPVKRTRSGGAFKEFDCVRDRLERRHSFRRRRSPQPRGRWGRRRERKPWKLVKFRQSDQHPPRLPPRAVEHDEPLRNRRARIRRRAARVKEPRPGPGRDFRPAALLFPVLNHLAIRKRERGDARRVRAAARFDRVANDDEASACGDAFDLGADALVGIEETAVTSRWSHREVNATGEGMPRPRPFPPRRSSVRRAGREAS